MAPARGGRTFTTSAATRRHYARTTLRTEWQTSSACVPHMSPARKIRVSTRRAIKRCTGHGIVTSLVSGARVIRARRSRPSTTRAETHRRTVTSMLRTELVDVGRRRLPNVSRRPVPGRHVPNNVETSAWTKLNTDLFDDSRIHVRKR